MSAPARSSIASLHDLRVDRSLLTLFVIGPGFGESVLLALPGSESWIVIDGAAPAGQPPAKGILERFWSTDASIELLLLTHPHADHYPGLINILEDDRLGPRIRRLGCVSQYLGVARGHTLGIEVEAAFEAIDIDDPDARRELGRARHVLERIGEVWLKQPALRWSAEQGAHIDLPGGATLRVLGPDRSHVRNFFTEPRLAERILSSANDLSVVLEIVHGSTRLLLGGDLPHTRADKPVASGWSHVCSTFPGLNGHTGYKIAHHASREAIHTGVVARAGSEARSWVATPYNKGAKLPAFNDGEGMHHLQDNEQHVMLTGLPVNIRGQSPLPDQSRRADLELAMLSPRRPLGPLSPPIASGPLTHPQPSECVWALQFDDRGQEVARFRGTAATIVT